MEIIRRNHKLGVKEYKIYNESEAKVLGILYSNWREATAGNYIITDDGWVMECYGAKEYWLKGRKKGVKELKFPFGIYWSNEKVCNYEDKRGSGKYKRKSWQEYEVKTTRGKRLVRQAVVQLVTKGKLDYEELGQVYRADQAQPSWTVRRVLKQKEFMEAIEAGLEERLIKKGLNPDYVIDLFKEVVQYAQDKKDPDALLRVAKELKIMLGMEAKRKTVIEQIETTNIQYLKDNMEKEEESLKLSRTTHE